MGGLLSQRAQPKDLGFAPHVPGRILTLLNQKCGAMQQSSQLAICSTIADKCPNLQVTCGNTANLTTMCTLSDTAAVAQTVLLAEPEVVRQEMLNQNSNFLTDITTSIQQNCSSAASAQQTVSETVTCTNSSSAVLNVLNSLDATTACATALVTDVVASARMVVAESNKDSVPVPPITNATMLLIAAGGTIVLFIAILVIGSVLRARARMNEN